MLAYFDCFSGISGDMTLGALIDLGVPPRWLQDTLTQNLPLAGFNLEVGSTFRHGIAACSVNVAINEEHGSRTYADIKALIEESNFSPSIKDKSLAIFKRLAVAESGIHKQPVDRVHFHEVGGVDALVDIIGTVLGFDYLGIQHVIASEIPTGSGFVKSSHGKLPVPAPATLAILKGVPIYGNNINQELVTPTGAAILTEMADSFEPIPVMRVDRIGYGAGYADLEEVPNVLRIIIGKLVAREENALLVVETNIDDMNPEIFGYLMDRLFEDGALDVFWIPIYMKKNRPGTMVQVLCHHHVKDAIITRLLSETTTAGVRFHEMHRQILEREQIIVQTTFGNVKVKRIKTLDGSTRMVPEYDDCRKIALKQGIPIRVVYNTIEKDTGSL